MIKFINNGKGGTDTSDATATTKDILEGKTAYGKDGKITGSYITPEAIYGVDEAAITPIPGCINREYFSKLDNVFMTNGPYNNSNNSGAYVHKIDNGQISYTHSTGLSVSSCALVNVIGDDVYYATAGDNKSSVNIYKFNCATNTNELYWTISGLPAARDYYYGTFFIGKNRILFHNNGYDARDGFDYVELDLINKSILVHTSDNYGDILNEKISYNADGSWSNDKYLCDYTSGNKIKANDVVRFVNKNSTKVIMGTTLYELGTNLELGGILKEHVFNNLDIEVDNSKQHFLHYDDDYYYLINNEGMGAGKGYLMKFNEDTNTFTNICELLSLRTQNAYHGRIGPQATFLNSNKEVCYLSSTKSDVIKGYKYDGHTMYFDKNVVNSGNILAGYQAYDRAGDTIAGTMANNGEINITPSTEEQTIPKGYTLGGVVAGDKNLIPENIKKGCTIFNVIGAYNTEDIMYELYGEIYDNKSTDLTTSLTKTCKVNCIPNNYVYAFLEYHGGTFDITESGWELLYSQDAENSNSDTELSAAVYYKLAENAEESFTYTYNATGPNDNKYNGICLISYKNNSKLLKTEYHQTITYNDSTREFTLPNIQKGDLLIVDTNSTTSSSGSVWSGDFDCQKIKPFALNSSYGNIWVINENKINAKLTKANVRGPHNILLLRTDVKTTQNLLPENIKKGIEIFGVIGTYEGETTTEVKEII